MYQPLTPEQFNKARAAGFTPQQITEMELRRKAQEGAPQTQQPQRNVLQKAAGFLGIEKFGQGLSTLFQPNVAQQQATQTAQNLENTSRLLKLYRQTTDPQRKQTLASTLKALGTDVTAGDINPGLNLSNREVLGSAGNLALSVGSVGLKAPSAATRLARVGQAAAQGAALGGVGAFTQGLSENKTVSEAVQAAPTGAIAGGVLGGASQSLAELGKLVFSSDNARRLMDKGLATPKKVVEKGRSPAQRFLDEGVSGTKKSMLDTSMKAINEADDEISGILTSNTAQVRSEDVKQQIRASLQEKFQGMLSTKEVEAMVNGLPIDMLNKNKTISVAQLNQLRKSIDNTYLGSAKWLNTSTAEGVIGLKTATNVMRGLVQSSDERLPSLFSRMSDYITARNSLTSDLAKPHILSNLIELAVAGVVGAASGQGDIGTSAKNAAAVFAAWNLLQSGVGYTKTASFINKAAGAGSSQAGQLLKAVGKTAGQAAVRQSAN